MIELVLDENGAIEIGDCSRDSTLQDLVDALGGWLTGHGACRRCTRCCTDVIPLNGFEIQRLQDSVRGASIAERAPYLRMPEPPDLHRRREGIREMQRTFEMSTKAATALYEHNNADPVCIAKADTGDCFFIRDGLCTRYSTRPLVCRLYHCRLGKRLSALNESIIAQGVWHSYSVLGWIDEKDLAHNPFVGAASYRQIRLDAFDHDFGDLVGQASYLL